MGRILATFDRRFYLVALVGSAAAALAFGIPTAVIPNPLFVRMTPTEVSNALAFAASVPLTGLLFATYAAPGAATAPDAREGREIATVGGLASFLAIGCPICNKLVVAALGVSGALNVFAPVQPVLGAAVVVLLAATLAWRIRLRAARCSACAA